MDTQRKEVSLAQKAKLALKKDALSQSESQALHTFAEQLQRTYPDQVRQVYLFGSKARGEAHADSDIDVLIITESEDRLLRYEIINLASDCSLEYGVLLNPRIIGVQRWQAKQGFSFYRNIARDARPVLVEGVFL